MQYSNSCLRESGRINTINLHMLFIFFSHLFYISNYCVKETVLQVVIDRLIEVGRCYGMEMARKNWGN
jgi:hypothetical protein